MRAKRATHAFYQMRIDSEQVQAYVRLALIAIETSVVDVGCEDGHTINICIMPCDYAYMMTILREACGRFKIELNID